MDERREQALGLMARFAERTGLSSGQPPVRYLWTDAFAVCNWLGLSRMTGDPRYTELALQLVDQVHHVLGRHRPDDRRRGWISGLDEAEGEAHPTRGGLRIGKPLRERAADALVDERLEWERDGQYFHYLTKWMHALNQVTRCTGQPLFNRWACELAETAHRAFTYPTASGRPARMYWKLSIDLSHPLVASMGQHDALDGLITYAQLQVTAIDPGSSLARAIDDFAAMTDPGGLATADPLGIGGLLVDAYRLAQLELEGAPSSGLVGPVLESALVGLRHYVKGPDLHRPASHRLAFRELGLAIGLAAVEHIERSAIRYSDCIDWLMRFLPLRNEIERFWLLPQHRSEETWLAHANINDVMLATSLEPTGFLANPLKS